MSNEKKEINPMKILITGGAGFIGSNLALSLSEKGHTVTVFDNLSPQIHGKDPEKSPLYLSVKNKVNFVRGDVTRREDLLNVLPDVDTVVHLAAETGTGQSMYEIQRYAEVNVGGTALLLDLITNYRFPISRIAVASSRAIYGEGKYYCVSHGHKYPGARSNLEMERQQFEHSCPICQQILQASPTDELSPLNPTSVYGVTKLTQEQMVLTVGKALGISALAFRYQNVYGPGQSLENPYTGILSIFSNQIRQGNIVNVFEDGRESRDFVFIDDAVDATIQGLEHKYPLVEAFNVGSGIPIDVSTVATTLLEYLGGNSDIVISGQYRVGDIRHNVADLKKVSKFLGFKAKVSFSDGLYRFVDWVQSEQLPDDFYEKSIEELRVKGLFR